MSMSSDKYEMLARKVELFRGLTGDDIEVIFSKGMTIRVPKGETLFYKGTVGNQMYVIFGGQIDIVDGKRVLASLVTGDMFGEMALVNSEPRSATAISVEDCTLFVLTETTFQRLLNKKVAVQTLLNIIRTLSHRLRETNRRLAKLQQMD